MMKTKSAVRPREIQRTVLDLERLLDLDGWGWWELRGSCHYSPLRWLDVMRGATRGAKGFMVLSLPRSFSIANI